MSTAQEYSHTYCMHDLCRNYHKNLSHAWILHDLCEVDPYLHNNNACYKLVTVPAGQDILEQVCPCFTLHTTAYMHPIKEHCKSEPNEHNETLTKHETKCTCNVHSK